MKVILGVVGVVVAIIVVFAVLILTPLGLRFGLVPIIGAVEQQEITNAGAYRIQAYEQFYRMEEDAQAIERKLNLYIGDLSTREKQECVGLVARHADIVSEYNSAVRSVNTQGKWQGSGLPNRLRNINFSC